MTRRILTRLSQFAWLAALAVTAPRIAAAQQSHSIDVGASYTYVHTNLLPGCDCFNTYGGSGEVQFGLSRHVALLGDVTATHQGNITRDHYSLTQTTFSAGLRYFPSLQQTRLRPFGDLLLGGAHASGSLSPGNTGEGNSTTFAFQTGGGLQLGLNRRWTLVPVQAEYLLTTFGNGAENRQNDLRLSAGILFRIRR
jgi:hypothetical protein